MNLPTFDDLLVAGGDERLDLDANGLNKYYVNPTISEGIFNRGSCTCSFITTEALKPTLALYDRFKENPDFDEIYDTLTSRIKSALDDSSYNFEVYISPSGSDLCYLPLLFKASISPDKPIMNMVTCPEELGSGSVLAYQGKFFSQRTQIEDVEIGEVVNPKIRIDFRSYPARDRDGNILDHKEAFLKDIEKYSSEYSLLANLVIGSKSGIEDNIAIIEETQHLDVTWVVDICQLRVSRKLIQKLLSLNCLLLITGSKFYQSPPFCGALIVPSKMEDQLKVSNPEKWVCSGFDRIFSSFDFPSHSPFRPFFQDKPNRGLLLRWEAAIYEFEKLSVHKESEVIRVVSIWNEAVRSHMLAHPEVFELMEGQEVTNKSIISFRIIKNGKYLDHKELKELYKKVCLTGKEFMPKYKLVTIGQPVAYASGSFLRMALGSYNVRKLINKELNLEEDIQLLEIIQQFVNEGD